MFINNDEKGISWALLGVGMNDGADINDGVNIDDGH